jgi:hypothetical protein
VGSFASAPDSTAVRVALWRAMHVQIDPPPHVLADEIGLHLAAPDEDWRQRGDMHPQGTSWPAPDSSRTWSSKKPAKGRGNT